MAITFSSTKDAGSSVNVLVYGESGVGKTQLIATCPKPIIISTESGLLTLKDYDLPAIGVKSIDDLQEAYDFVLDSIEKGKYKTVCLDSMSDIADTALSHLFSKYTNKLQAYGHLNNAISEKIRQFRDLDINTYIIAKSEIYENSSGMQSLRASMPTKKLTNDLDFAFDVVLCLQVNEDDEDATYRFLQTQKSPTIKAKDRSKRLNRIEKPDMRAIFKKIKD